MNLPTGHDLISLGVKQDHNFGKILKSAQTAVQNGEAWELVQAQIREDTDSAAANTPIYPELRKEAVSISIAADPKTDEEISNVEASLKRMHEVAQCPKVTKATLMPDTCPTGGEFGSIPVGGGILTDNVVIPAAHSADLFCSMWATFFLQPNSQTPNWEKLLESLAHNSRFGPYLRREYEALEHEVLSEIPWKNPFLKGLEDKALLGLGTQGDGNHFAYLGETTCNESFLNGLRATHTHDHQITSLEKLLPSRKNEFKLTTLVTHHGSRNFGAMVYKRGIEAAILQTNGPKKDKGLIPKNLCWLDLTTPQGADYLEALYWVGRWTRANHQVIHRDFATLENLSALVAFGNEHNAIWQDPQDPTRILHGKGATPAWYTSKGYPQIGVIPLNMSAPILLTLGQNNQEYLGFSPHGAGRNRSRTETMAPFKDPITKKINQAKLEAAIAQGTQGTIMRWWSGKPDFSETPLGYKNPDEIRQQIEEFKLANIFSLVQPRACIMAGEILAPWKKGKKKKPKP